MHESEPAILNDSGRGDVEITGGAHWQPDSTSPTLGSTQSVGVDSYELKFLVDENLAARLESSFSSWLSMDPHADRALNYCYRVTSIYTDTPRLDVFHRQPGYQQEKYRIRRYGDESRVYFENKIKRGQRVRKSRTVVSASELERLAEPENGSAWSGGDYSRELKQRELGPVCRITYLRRAYFACTAGDRLRLTFDRELQGRPVSGWSFEETQPEQSFSADRVICEFKFQQSLPGAFKRAIEEFNLIPTGFSKYRTCMTTLGLATTSGAAASA
jgi:hypothetical protein